MPERTRRWYRDFLRLRLGIKTPRERWTEAVSFGWDHEDLPPPYGAQPTWAMEPSNYLLDSAIATACGTVIRECRVQNALRFTDVNIPAQTAFGPFILRLDALPGFSPGGVVTLRRSMWTTDVTAGTWYPVYPVNLSQQDTYQSNYMNDGPGTPFQIAIEGNLVYVLPGPDTDGTLRLTVGSGVLAPLTDEEGYDGIPEAYDDAINYIALVELAAMMPGDNEMARRAQSFAPFAVQGISQLTGFFDNMALDEFAGVATWTTSVTRTSKRN